MEIILPEKKPAGFQKGHIGFKGLRTKPDFTAKTGRYFLARQRGLNKTEAMKEVGASSKNIANYEKTPNYKLCEATYAGNLLDEITLREIAQLNVRNAKQEKDIGGSNTAIKMMVDKIEPENQVQQAQQINIVIEDDGDKERTISTTQGNFDKREEAEAN